MTTFCVKSVDHCKKLVAENEGKGKIRDLIYRMICATLLELRGPMGDRGERGHPGLPGISGEMGPLGPPGEMMIIEYIYIS